MEAVQTQIGLSVSKLTHILGSVLIAFSLFGPVRSIASEEPAKDEFDIGRVSYQDKKSCYELAKNKVELDAETNLTLGLVGSIVRRQAIDVAQANCQIDRLEASLEAQRDPVKALNIYITDHPPKDPKIVLRLVSLIKKAAEKRAEIRKLDRATAALDMFEAQAQLLESYDETRAPYWKQSTKKDDDAELLAKFIKKREKRYLRFGKKIVRKFTKKLKKTVRKLKATKKVAKDDKARAKLKKEIRRYRDIRKRFSKLKDKFKEFKWPDNFDKEKIAKIHADLAEQASRELAEKQKAERESLIHDSDDSCEALGPKIVKVAHPKLAKKEGWEESAPGIYYIDSARATCKVKRLRGRGELTADHHQKFLDHLASNPPSDVLSATLLAEILVETSNLVAERESFGDLEKTLLTNEAVLTVLESYDDSEANFRKIEAKGKKEKKIFARILDLHERAYLDFGLSTLRKVSEGFSGISKNLKEDRKIASEKTGAEKVKAQFQTKRALLLKQRYKILVSKFNAFSNERKKVAASSEAAQPDAEASKPEVSGSR